MIVCKFGGTSVEDAGALRRLHTIVADRVAEKPLVVVSALAGVSDLLVSTFEDGADNEPRLDGRAASTQTQSIASSPGPTAYEALATRHFDLMCEVAGAEACHRLDPWLEALRAGPRRGSAQGQAEWLALGELLASAIVTAALEAWGLRATWFDVRSVMRTRGENPIQDRPDREVLQRLVDRHLRHSIEAGGIVVTQGFIGCDAGGRTTLLGRGGSDFSASLLGAALQAERLEIWTDVDGIMTAPPRLVPGARRLRVLSFDEAAELAYFGAKVLHPATLHPAQEAAIPVLVANSRRPKTAPGTPGTLILPDTTAYHDERAVVRSVAVKHGVTVVTVHSTRMLMAHGFLERIFAVFAKHSTPVDLVSTAEVSVSLTVDDPRSLQAIVDELRAIARVEVAPEMAIICVVGDGMRRARGIAARLFRAVGSTEVRMISQGASEINVSLVVADAEADDVVRRLHEEFFQGNLPRAVFGESFADLETAPSLPASPPSPHRLARVAADLAAKHGTPFYVYELDRVEAQIQRLRTALDHSRARLAYACKANFHPALFFLMRDQGVGIDAVSPMEVERALQCGIPADQVLFTANNVSVETLLAVHDQGVRVNLGSLSDVRRFAAHRAGTEVFLRTNPGIGAGHHAHVVTGGMDSKFGILAEDLQEAREILAARDIRVVGLHAHIGSGSLDAAPHLEAARRLVAAATAFPHLRSLNVGGGLGVPYRRGEPEFALESYGAGLREMLQSLEAALGRTLELWVEPGRFLVAQAGTLVARVTCRKETAGHIYVGLDSGMNHLVRPALYGAYHAIRNLSAPGAPLESVDVVGNICESADVFAMSRPLPSPQEGHLLAIENAGAYGFAMASHYNLWPLPREFVLRDGAVLDA